MFKTPERSRHDHVFLGESHGRSERNVWATIALTAAMMLVEIVGGAMFGSIALVADGFHMLTHVGALLLTALAYTLARRHARDERFTFGAGKFGDLAGFSSALILAMIALGVGYESAARLFSPTAIDFAEALPIAAVGLAVNVASAWLLSRGGGHGHHHHGGAGEHHSHDETRRLEIAGIVRQLSIFEDGVPPRFRLAGAKPGDAPCHVETVRPDGARRLFAMRDRGGFLESFDEIPEPHAFEVSVTIGAATATCRFQEHAHGEGAVGRDNNMRAAVVHVIADAAVSVLVIAGLVLSKVFGWLWMDPLVGLVGAAVIANWAYGLIRDTGRVLLDMNPDPKLCHALRQAIERDGDTLADMHLWRLGPGHLGAILSVETTSGRARDHYQRIAEGIGEFSHLTIEIARPAAPPDRGIREVA